MAAKQVPLVSFMPGPYPKTVFLVMLLSLFLLNTVNTAATAQQHAARKRPAKQAQPVPPPPPAPPPPPPTLEQMPAVPPKVSFKNGMLTIVAENSTLGDILRAVRTHTGAAVEVPPNATERVVTRLGPGAPRDVLASLLNGSHFNYVMLGSPTNPDKVDRVILTSKSGGVPDAGSAPIAPGQNNPEPVANEEPEPQPGMDISEQPVEDPAENAANEENQPQPPNGQMQVKTPEQLLRELQQQQQQQQQQQPPQGAPPAQAPQ
jgi:hypothetical protein